MNTHSQTSKNEIKVQKIAKLSVSLCWGLLFLIITVSVLVPYLFTHINGLVDYTDMMNQAVLKGIISGVFWIPLLYLITQFFGSCHKRGLFTKKTVRSMRWIAGFVLFFGTMRIVAILASVWIVPLQSSLFFASGLGSGVTGFILGLYLLALSFVLAAAKELKDENQLTV